MTSAIDKTDLLNSLLSKWKVQDQTVHLIKDRDAIEYVTAHSIREYTEQLLWEVFQIHGREEIVQAIVKVDSLYKTPYIDSVVN